MATYGAKYIQFAPFTAEPEEKMPTYGEAIGLAELQKAGDSPKNAVGKQYGDNGLSEIVSEFSEGELTIEITDLPPETEDSIFGIKPIGSSDNEVHCFGDNAQAPYGAVSFISCIVRNNVKSYQGIFYPKCKADMQGEEFETKGENITLKGGKLKFVCAKANVGDWKMKSPRFPTEAKAKAWISGLQTGTIPVEHA